MSFHNKPNYQIPELIEALKAHRLPHDTPSQLADSFRIGWMACRELAQAGSGFDYKTAADLLSGKTVSDEALRKFVAASRGAHDGRAALHAKMLSLQGELASREAEIALLKRSLLDAEADAAAPQPPTAPATQQAGAEPPGIQALMCVISSLRDMAHFSDEEGGELMGALCALRDWAHAQPVAEASRFGSPELQARIIARSAEKDQAESVYAFRRKGLEDFCTCDEARYEELSNKPHLFETRVFYTAPQPSPTTQADNKKKGPL